MQRTHQVSAAPDHAHREIGRRRPSGAAIVGQAPEAAAQRRRVESINSSPCAAAQRAACAGVDGSVRCVAQRQQLGALFGAGQAAAARPSRLPDALKSGIERLSGISMDQVVVHRDSTAPAQIGALAYARGSEIHLAPGQERHLPHEAWHLVQQAQGRVRATLQAQGGVAVNDEAALEREADVMGARATTDGGQASPAPGPARGELAKSTQAPQPLPVGEAPVVAQRAVGFEFEDPSVTVFKLQTGRSFRNPDAVTWYKPWTWSMGQVAPPEASQTPSPYGGKNIWQSDDVQGRHINAKVGKFNLQTGPKKGTLHAGPGYDIEPDGPYSDVGGVTNRMDLEVVTKPFPETPQGRGELVTAMQDLKQVYGRLATTVGAWGGGDFAYGSFITPATHRFTDQTIYLYGGRAGGAFKPQVTSGQELADLPELMQTLGVGAHETPTQSRQRAAVRTLVFGTADAQQLGEDATVSAMGNAPMYAQAVIDALIRGGVLHGGLAGLDTLKGFLAQAILNMTVLSPTSLEGIKVHMPLLSRLSMATLFTQVPEHLRSSLTGVAGRPGLLAAVDTQVKLSIRQFLSRKYRGEGYQSMIDTRSSAGLQGPMITSHLKERVDGVERTAAPLVAALNSITREEWLSNLLDGRDLLTPADMLQYLQRESASTGQKAAARDYGKSVAVYLRGYGNTSHVKDVEGECTGSLALLENRNINPWLGKGTATQGISVDEAETFALGYFDWLMAIKRARALIRERQQAQSERLRFDASTARSTNFWG